MTFYPVPWAVGGGAENSPETARNALHIATSRAEGIIGTPDLRVQERTVPGAGVRIGPGSCLIRNRSAAYTQQSYSAYSESDTLLGIAPTGSSGGRSDLIVVRIEDPFVSGTPWQTPADVRSGPYVFPRVISNVPAGATTMADAGRSGDSAIVLARVDIPANTATITQAMLTDLRKMALPRIHSETNSNQNATTYTMASDAWVVFPYGPSIIVPDWATHVNVQCTLSGVKGVGNVDGEMAVRLVDAQGTVYVNQQAQKYDIDVGATGGGAQRFTVNLNVYGSIVAGRGKVLYQQVRMHRLQARPDRGDIYFDNGSTVLYRTDFYERPALL